VDVAHDRQDPRRRAGVSPATVSNAYNRPDQLSPQLRHRILATAAELGYPGPDAAGRTLRMGRADAVGVLLAERQSYAFSDPSAIEFLTGLSEVVEEHGIRHRVDAGVQTSSGLITGRNG
jgi:DNA-binding LacI/PurR family transcriptional regulator